MQNRARWLGLPSARTISDDSSLRWPRTRSQQVRGGRTRGERARAPSRSGTWGYPSFPFCPSTARGLPGAAHTPASSCPAQHSAVVNNGPSHAARLLSALIRAEAELTYEDRLPVSEQWLGLLSISISDAHLPVVINADEVEVAPINQFPYERHIIDFAMKALLD